AWRKRFWSGRTPCGRSSSRPTGGPCYFARTIRRPIATSGSRRWTAHGPRGRCCERPSRSAGSASRPTAAGWSTSPTRPGLTRSTYGSCGREARAGASPRAAARRQPHKYARERDEAVRTKDQFPLAPPIEPMLAKLAESLPDDGTFLFEPKWDGFRAIVFRGAADVYIQSRDLKPLDRYFPELHDSLLERLPKGRDRRRDRDRHGARSRLRRAPDAAASRRLARGEAREGDDLELCGIRPP